MFAPVVDVDDRATKYTHYSIEKFFLKKFACRIVVVVLAVARLWKRVVTRRAESL